MTRKSYFKKKKITRDTGRQATSVCVRESLRDSARELEMFDSEINRVFFNSFDESNFDFFLVTGRQRILTETGRRFNGNFRRQMKRECVC